MSRDESLFPIRCASEAMMAVQADLRRFGFASIENAIDDALLLALRGEATEQRVRASGARATAPVAYQARTVELGNVARSFLASSPLTTLLETVFGTSFAVTEQASCYTYYEPGDFLGPHRDKPEDCAATAIVYLDAVRPDPPSPDSGLLLRIYGEQFATGTAPRTVIHSRIGTLVVGHGSRTWHERPLLQAGESVAALTACFRVVARQGDLP